MLHGSKPRLYKIDEDAPPVTYEQSVLSITGIDAYYPLNDTSGIVAVEKVAGNDGAYEPNDGFTWTDGTVGESMSVLGYSNVAGFGGYVNCSTPVVLNFSGPFTLEGWFHPGLLSSYQILIAKSDGTATGAQYELRTNPAGNVDFLTVVSGALVSTTGATVLTLGVWVHLVAVYDGTDLRIYVNGALDNVPVSASGPVTANSEPVAIGARRLSTTPQMVYQGEAAGIAFYGAALSAAQIAANYAKGAAA